MNYVAALTINTENLADVRWVLICGEFPHLAQRLQGSEILRLLAWLPELHFLYLAPISRGNFAALIDNPEPVECSAAVKTLLTAASQQRLNPQMVSSYK